MPIIAADPDRHLARTLAALGRADPDLARARARAGPLPDRSRPPGFESLVRIMVQQQVSIASANAIWRRLRTAIEPFTAAGLAATPDSALAAAGLSRPKQAYCRSLAAAVVEGGLDLDGLARLDDRAAIEALVAIKGIGRWTAEIYLLFCLGRPDMWPAHDVALQVAVHDLKHLDARPTWREMDRIAEPWRPWRGTAARLLWCYYRVLKDRADPSGGS